ncbi:hypothetical protein RFI_35259 [Reticulomyxa filosa]|uniref:Uncharacterized protein n=1 Tax=Reticulomyxa filosa TaxID=46433 RepID=X6LKM1_RETFI|nr:hypothetical protein RFI_35259 [Reticulomyxa filosa]|eukprot:ETO02179.1 hypothetical protein RFI_35259 [Reticulomyxa filosa]
MANILYQIKRNKKDFLQTANTLFLSDNIIRICDVASRKEVKQLEGHSDSVNDVKYFPDGQTILLNFYAHLINIFHFKTTKKALFTIIWIKMHFTKFVYHTIFQIDKYSIIGYFSLFSEKSLICVFDFSSAKMHLGKKFIFFNISTFKKITQTQGNIRDSRHTEEGDVSVITEKELKKTRGGRKANHKKKEKINNCIGVSLFFFLLEKTISKRKSCAYSFWRNDNAKKIWYWL